MYIGRIGKKHLMYKNRFHWGLVPVVLGICFAMTVDFGEKEKGGESLLVTAALGECITEEADDVEIDVGDTNAVGDANDTDVAGDVRVAEERKEEAWGAVSDEPEMTMYLTFDDGPSAENTGAILDVLKGKNIKATFFVIGENVRKHPEVAKRMAEEGHAIGIHCYSHEYNTLYECVDSYLDDFQMAYDTVYEVTGVEAKIFRFPGGSINGYNKDIYEDIIKAMAERGYVYFDWNASLEDAVQKSEPEQLLQNARETTLGRKKIIMLAHDTVHNTALCLEDLIAQFPEYKMEALTADVTPIHFKKN